MKEKLEQKLMKELKKNAPKFLTLKNRQILSQINEGKKGLNDQNQE